jgi:hypothetical protein
MLPIRSAGDKPRRPHTLPATRGDRNMVIGMRRSERRDQSTAICTAPALCAIDSGTDTGARCVAHVW